jgi:hypothetical protein
MSEFLKDVKFKTTVRDLLPHELILRDELFTVAERFQGLVAGKLRELLGEPAYDQSMFNMEQRVRRAEALFQCAYTASFDSRERHASWCLMHSEQGWTYGPEFRPDLKQHPNLVPWEELPTEAKVKADIFAYVAHFTADLFALAADRYTYAQTEADRG